MITRIYIDNFRCFSNFELKPRRINLLIGANGSGKSSLLDVIDRFLSLILDGHEVDQLFQLTDFTRWDARQEQRFEIDLSVEKLKFSYSAILGRGRLRRSVELLTEHVECDGRVLFHYELGTVQMFKDDGVMLAAFPFKGKRSFLAGIEERAESTKLPLFLDRARAIRTFKLEPPQMGSQTAEEHAALSQDGTNFPSWYRTLSQEYTGSISALFDQLSEALPGFQSLALKGAGKQGRMRDLVVQMKTQDNESYEIDFESISDGQRALIVLHAMLVAISAGPCSVFLDEPENYVGLAELQPWLQRLDDTLGSTGQLFLISHHPEVIDFLAPENPIRFERLEGGPVRASQAAFERESGLKASEQIARELLDVH